MYKGGETEMSLQKIFYIINVEGRISHGEVFVSKRKATEILRHYVLDKKRLYILVGEEFEDVDTYLFRLKINTRNPQFSLLHPSIELLKKDWLWLKYARRDGELKKKPRSEILKYKINKEKYL